jgi:ABC-2 type transport system permease protein
MKTIFKIALLELKTLFSSPIAWLLLIIFTVQTSLIFITQLKAGIVVQGLGFQRDIMDDLIRSNLTEKIFGYYMSPDPSVQSLFPKVVSYWYLYIPLLTMGLISRELSSGNIKLLFSSPIKASQIVWGKFTGIMLYWALLMTVLLLFALSGCLFIHRLDLPMFLSGILGLYLLAMLYSALGLFVSCLTQYQIVAALSTFVVLGMMNYFGGMWQGTPFLRDITWFINTEAHTNNLLLGLIVSRDVIYFLMLSLMFIGLSTLALQDKVHSRPLIIKAARYIILVTLVLLMGYAVTRPQVTLYADVTANKINTLTPASQAVLKKIKGPVDVTIYDNLLMDYKGVGRPDHVNANISTWEPYKRFLPGLGIRYVHFYDAQAVDGSYPGGPKLSLKAAAKAAAADQHLNFDDYLPPDSIHKKVDLRFNNNGTILKLSNGKTGVFMRRLTDLDVEAYVTANFKRMLYGADTIGFLSGNGERSIENDGEHDYKFMMSDHTSTYSLNENGFEAVSIKPDKPIPPGVRELVIADPATPYTAEALQHIRDYIAAGGNLLILKGDNDGKILEKITAPLGVTFMPGTVVQPNEEKSANHINVRLVRSALDDTTYTIPEWNIVMLENATALQLNQGGAFKIAPVLVTDAKDTWNKALTSTLDTGKLQYHPEQGDIHEALPVAAALTRNVQGKQQRILIAGDAHMMQKTQSSPILVQTIFRWMSYGKFPLTKLRKDGHEDSISLSFKQADLLKYFFILFIPGILILNGSIYLLKRRSL